MKQDPTPEIRAEQTINHPQDPARVLGFISRDTVRGHAAVVLKGEELPEDDPLMGIPRDTVDFLKQRKYLLYVLDGDEVHGCTYVELNDIVEPLQTTWNGQLVTVESFNKEDMTTWERDSVEVTT